MGLRPAPRTPNTTFPRRPRLDFPDSLVDGFARKSARPMHQTYAAVAQGSGFAGSHEAPGALIQQGPDRTKLRPQLSNSAHLPEA